MTQAIAHHAGSALGSPKPAFTHGILEGILRFFALRRTQRELARLDDRMLADIGLTRSDIHSAATQAAYAPTRKNPYWG